MNMTTYSICIVLVLACLPAARAEKNDWAEGVAGRDDGATRDYYNRAGLLRWKNFLGDWRDARDVAQGEGAFATAAVGDSQKDGFVEWDVTRLVREWLDGRCQNQGLFLRRVKGDGNCHFRSREYSNASSRPQLVITTRSGSVELAAAADTYLEPSTYRPMGQQDTLRVGGRNHALLRFDLKPIQKKSQVKRATLRLFVCALYGKRPTEIGVFRSAQGHDLPPSQPVPGVATRYDGDQGVERDPATVFFTDFESAKWAEQWTYVAPRKLLRTVDSDADRRFEPLRGRALRVKIAEGSTGALNTLFKFQRETGEEPEEIYFRYYLRLADDWNQIVQGGKLPGISGTYGVAGWGGRPSNGRNGWSARGAFHRTIPEGNPLGGLHPIGTYCYHADMKGQYGNVWLWQDDYRGFLRKNHWYCVEQYLKLNTPGNQDGVIRAWIDGRPAFEKTDIRFRLVDRLKIEQVWMNVYHGGKKPSPFDQHLYIDNVVIARKYIGPLKGRQ